jgi:hypothetical protein
MPMPTKPLGLSDSQFTQLINCADQIHRADRDRFLRAVAARFQGRSELGDGEFARGLRELLHGGFFKAPVISTPQPARHDRASRLKSAAPLA